MSDTEWLALLPYVYRRSGPGRPLRELRTRMDGIFRLSTSHDPWHTLPAEFGKPDTVARYFRRLTHAGLWQRLLTALAETPETHPLRALEAWICRACRRAYRILGLAILVLARRLDFLSALRGPPWLLPNPDLSESLARLPIPLPRRGVPGSLAACRAHLKALRILLRHVGGLIRVSPFLQRAWP
jgi:transposase